MQTIIGIFQQVKKNEIRTEYMYNSKEHLFRTV